MLGKVIGDSWVPILQKEFDSEYLQKLAKWISYTRNSQTIYPESDDVFKALQLCPHGQVKVVILGQDPYHNGIADGLAFSYKNGQRADDRKQSLDVILDEIEEDCYSGFNVNRDYQLDYLAKQGVLLLNSVLTVFRGKPGSHKGLGWERLTQRILISQLADFKSKKVFLIWGAEAKKVMDEAIYQAELEYAFAWTNHLILYAKHPASDLYNRDTFGKIVGTYPEAFTGCKHFSQANKFLLDNNIGCIDWYPTIEPYLNPKLSDTPPF